MRSPSLRASSLTAFRQPRYALDPQAFALEAAEQWALERASHLSADRLRLTSFWNIDFTIQHVPRERKARYTMRLAQSENYGLACGFISPHRDNDPILQAADHDLVGEDSREILKSKKVRDEVDRTALIDLVMEHVSAPANDRVVVDQTMRDKHALKSRLFADEVDLTLQRKGLGAIKGTKPHILVIGAMAGTISELLTRGFEVSATDMSPDVVGQNLGGATISEASDNARLIKAADLVIITGMTLPNRTLPGIIQAAKSNNTSTLIWAVTGKNFGQYYTDHGVDCVIADPSPFIFLPGPACLGIWRRET